MKFQTFLKTLSFWLVVIGAINWGLVGFFGYNVVESLLGASSMGTRIVYDAVGVSAVLLLWNKYK